MELIDKQSINLSGVHWWLPDAHAQVIKAIEKTPVIAKVQQNARTSTLVEILRIVATMNNYEVRQLLYSARNIHQHYGINKIYCEGQNDKGSI